MTLLEAVYSCDLKNPIQINRLNGLQTVWVSVDLEATPAQEWRWRLNPTTADLAADDWKVYVADQDIIFKHIHE